jgi:hypothetical protein
MRRQFVSLALIPLIFLSIKLAYANTFEITPGLSYFNYQEIDENNALLNNRDEGVLAGVRLSYGDVTEKDSLKFNASFYSGTVDYAGTTPLGAPHETETNEQLIKLGISYIQHEETYYPGLFFVGLHYWYWDRDRLPGNGEPGLHKQYTWYETEIGLKFKSQEAQESDYWLELSVMYNFKPEMKLFLPSSEVGVFLGSRPGYRIRAGKTWTSKQSMTTTIGLFAEYWEFGKSNSIVITDFFGSTRTFNEGDSEFFHSGIEFSFIFNF